MRRRIYSFLAIFLPMFSACVEQERQTVLGSTIWGNSYIEFAIENTRCTKEVSSIHIIALDTSAMDYMSGIEEYRFYRDYIKKADSCVLWIKPQHFVFRGLDSVPYYIEDAFGSTYLCLGEGYDMIVLGKNGGLSVPERKPIPQVDFNFMLNSPLYPLHWMAVDSLLRDPFDRDPSKRVSYMKQYIPIEQGNDQETYCIASLDSTIIAISFGLRSEETARKKITTLDSMFGKPILQKDMMIRHGEEVQSVDMNLWNSGNNYIYIRQYRIKTGQGYMFVFSMWNYSLLKFYASIGKK